MSQSAVPTKPVVTLFEQYGAGADYIGPKLAERFGVQYVGYRWSSEELEQLHATPAEEQTAFDRFMVCLLYTSPSPRDRTRYRMPSSA